MTRFPAPGAPFEANKQFESDMVYEDLAAVGNLPEFRRYRHETFTTDRLGYRNLPAPKCAQGVSAILVGDSFGVGASLDDNQTLAVQLSALTGRCVYNAAGLYSDSTPNVIRQLAEQIDLEGGLVVIEHLERLDVPEPPVAQKLEPPGPPSPPRPTGDGGRLGRARRALGKAFPQLKAIAAWARSVRSAVERSEFLEVLSDSGHSPLRIIGQRFCKALQNDVILPNPYASLVSIRRLKNGDRFCFLREEIDTVPADDRVDRAVRYWSWMAAELKEDRFSVLVVLVPNKFTVYQPLLCDPSSANADSERFLARLEQRLREAGVPVVNLAPRFRAAASAGLDRRSYIYWPADIHWKAVGAGLAAEMIRDAWFSSLTAKN